MSSENKDVEKVPAKDQALFLKCNFQCKNAESTEAVLSFLKAIVAYQLQTPIPGVLVYHFSHPDPVNQPFLLQFYELYKDAAVFFEHSADKKIQELYGETFFPADKNKEWSTLYAYGRAATENPQLKAVCDFMNSTYCDTIASGYLLPDDPASVLAAGHPDPVLALCGFMVKKGDENAVLSLLKSITTSTDNNALLYNVGNFANQDDACIYDITSAYVSNSDLIKHLDAVKENFQAIHKLSLTSFRFQIFGEISPSSKSALDNSGFPIEYGKADTGYVLHPIAEQAFQN
eukprot:gene18981-20888_t